MSRRVCRLGLLLSTLCLAGCISSVSANDVQQSVSDMDATALADSSTTAEVLSDTPASPQADQQGPQDMPLDSAPDLVAPGDLIPPDSIDCSADNYCNPNCASDPDCQQNCAADNFCNSLCGESDPDCPHTCKLDGICEPANKCTNAPDPDCGCTCNNKPNVCEPKAQGSTEPCACDPDCLPNKQPCQLDCHCDSWCPKVNGVSTDPDCSAAQCDYNDGICEPKEKDSSEPCPYDCDCAGGKQPCTQDGHCDSWCPKVNGVSSDPDC